MGVRVREDVSGRDGVSTGGRLTGEDAQARRGGCHDCNEGRDGPW